MYTTRIFNFFTPSFLHQPGGVAGQLEYVASGGASFNPAATQGLYNDHNDFLDSRAEAKKAHAERMQHLRQVLCIFSMFFIYSLFFFLF